MIQIVYNGEKNELEEGLSISGLLNQKDLLRKGKTAVLINGELISSSQYNDIIISEGDSVEIITLAAGG